MRHRLDSGPIMLSPAALTIVASRKFGDVAAYSRRRRPTPPMQIRIVKNPPAPRMDGWDVSGFCVGQEYEVESRIGNYLIIAGYAVRVERDGKPERHDSGAART